VSIFNNLKEEIKLNNISLIKFTGVEGVKNPENFVPERKSDGAVGYDIKAARVLDKITRAEIGIFPVEIKPNKTALIGIGVVMAIPEGIDCEVRPRSGLATKYDINLANAPGTVDPDYRGEVACALRNNGNKSFTVNYGDRIGQLIFTPIFLPEFLLVNSIADMPITARKSGGFGSTGISSNEGHGTKNYDARIRKIDKYMMKIVLATAELSNCARGCKKDDNGNL
jgi:dUTP pyrophosphatase